MWADRGPREGPHLQASGKGWGGGCTLGGRERRDRRTGRLAQWRAGLRDAPVSDSRAGSGGAAGLASGPRSRPIHSSSPVGMRLPVSLLWARPALSTAGIKGPGSSRETNTEEGLSLGTGRPLPSLSTLGSPARIRFPRKAPVSPAWACAFSGPRTSAFLHLQRQRLDPGSLGCLCVLFRFKHSGHRPS